MGVVWPPEIMDYGYSEPGEGPKPGTSLNIGSGTTSDNDLESGTSIETGSGFKTDGIA